MIYVAPVYISKRHLPYASDVFFHQQLVYFAPTGIFPFENQSVLDFPQYCYERKIALPGIYWDFCSLYFANSYFALQAADILKPLRDSKNIEIIALSYSRDLRAIQESIQIMRKHPNLRNKILRSPLDIEIISREVCSHLLHEVMLEKNGFDGVVRYLEQYKHKDQIETLVSAVVVNRLRALASFYPLLVFDEYWIDILNEIPPLRETMEGKEPEIQEVDILSSRLFASILSPLYGRCDSLKKNQIVAQLTKEKRREIENLINICRSISTDFLLMQTKDIELKRTKLSFMLEERIIDPLSDFLEQSKEATKKFLVRSIMSSGVIASLISMAIQPSFLSFGISAAAGTISAGISQFVEQRTEKKNPTKFLITSIRKMKVRDDVLAGTIRKIPQQVIPEK